LHHLELKVWHFGLIFFDLRSLGLEYNTYSENYRLLLPDMIYNDSRRAAIKIYRNLKRGWIWAGSTFVGNALLSTLFTYLFSTLGYAHEVNFVFFVSTLAIGLWITESIPPFVVSIVTIALLLVGFGTDFILPDYHTPHEPYIQTWTSHVIWLLLGGFFLAEGMTIARLDRSLFQFTLERFGSNQKKLLYGFMLTTALGSMVMSNTAITAMMITSVLPFIRHIGTHAPLSKALLIGIPAAATLGGMGTIIGSTPNAIAVGALAELGIHLNFTDWMAFGLPTALLTCWIVYIFLRKGLPNETISIPDALKTDTVVVPTATKRIVVITFILTIGMWITEPLHAIPIAATSALPIVLLTLFQIVNSQRVRSLPWDTLMLVAGGLSLGIALVTVGLTDILLEHLLQTVQTPLWIAVILAFVGVALSNVMSNTAAASILIPVGISMPGIWGLVSPLVIALSCSSALLFPVSTPSNAIAYSTGLLAQKDFRRVGLLLVLIGPILALTIISLYVLLTTYIL
jgi:sodium-dependent dicarboxylate transporter 2/3/5